MKKRCPYCGDMIRVGVAECEHCGKILKKESASAKENVSPSDLESWRNRSIPSWMMYGVTGLCLFCVFIMYAQGCERLAEQQEDGQTPVENNQSESE